MTRYKLKSNLPTVLLTGFDAFGGDTINPSWLVAQALDGETIQGHLVVAAQLPTQFAASRKLLAALLRKHQPALVLCLGLAGGRAGLWLERIAINVQDARIADNAGAQPIDKPIVPRGPAAYFSTLPIKAMQRAIENQGVPVEISQTAGTFVCNSIFYALLHQLSFAAHKSPKNSLVTQRGSQSSQVPCGGFIHVPYLPNQGTPHMELHDMVLGVRTACACALATGKDISQSAGTLS